MPDIQQPDSTLTTFGGLVTELNPADLPAGSSPLCCDCDFTIGSVKTRLGESPVYASIGATNFNYIKSFEMTAGDALNLALDNTGTFWQEDIEASPGILNPFYTAILPGSFAKSVTEDDREFIALSDLQNGTDMPRQYDGTTVNRVSQVGPGAGCQVSSISTSYNITSISQIGTKTLGDGTGNYYVLWSAGPTLKNAGNIITFYGKIGTTWPGAGPTGQLQAGDQVVISGVQTMNGFNPNSGIGTNGNAYVVTSVGTAQGASGTSPIFTILVNQIGFYDQPAANTSLYEPTLATLVTSVPVPNLQVGGQLTISGATPGTWDGTFPALQTPNGAQMAINSTSLTGNLATYDFTLISGVNPTAGQQVTVAGTSNGNNIFNVTNAIIKSVAAGSFSVTIISPNIASAAETGSAIVNATQFQFDPGQAIANDTIGSLVVAGNLGAGTRGCVVMFLTDADALTEPSPQTIFTLSGSASSIVCSNIPTGPPNTKARVIAFTGAGGATLAGGGGFYYWIEQPVSVISNNQVVIYSATIINDNTTTQATLTFTDAVLIDATPISVQGANQFELVELGSCKGFIAYSNRLFAWGENNKIQNLLNPTFDGGIGKIIPKPGDASTVTQTYPLGWTVDSTYGADGSVVLSPIFGNAYQISQTAIVPASGIVNTSVIGNTITWVSGNQFLTSWVGLSILVNGNVLLITAVGSATSMTVAHVFDTLGGVGYTLLGTQFGMIEQSAYQDSFGAPIIEAGKTYSIRVTANASVTATSTINFDLYSPSLARIYGLFSINCASLTANMQIFTGTLLTTAFSVVPPDLLLRIYAGNVATQSALFTGTIAIDRIEPFDTFQPVLSTQLRASYENNFEAFDGVTGNLGVGVQNQQPVSTAFCLFDNLYVVRSNSFCSTADNGITEPNLWNIKEVAGIGTPSINGVDYSGDNDEESWALIAGQAGLYIFDGSQPKKISPEIDTLWQTINWKYGYTLWVRNDIINRRIMIGVPLPTPNQWMPNFPTNANPTQPNVVLMMSYRELMSSGAVEGEGAIRQSFMGELKTYQLGRKWSAWSIQACYADFIARPDTTQPIFFCDDENKGKIYQLLSGNYLDDGAAIPWDYIASPMPKTIEAQQLGMGNQMLLTTWMNALLEGNGNCALTIYPDTIQSPYAESLLPMAMSSPPSFGDTEIPLQQMGARFFMEFSNGDVAAGTPNNFELSRMVMSMQKHPWSVLRGSNA